MKFWFTRKNTKLLNTSSCIDVRLGDIITPAWLKTRSIGADDACTENIR